MIPLFFGVGTGRCATLSLANALGNHNEITCFHEGFSKKGADRLIQYLPNLTLQNFQAYKNPESALALFEKTRLNQISSVKGHFQGSRAIGDVGYYNSMFISAIDASYPESKFIYLVRNPISFVRSATIPIPPDEFPIGWQDWTANKPADRFVSLGRLRPFTGYWADCWSTLPAKLKNLWLWFETNRCISDQLARLTSDRFIIVEFDRYIHSTNVVLNEIFKFLEVTPVGEGEISITNDNQRKSPKIPDFSTWTLEERDVAFLLAEQYKDALIVNYKLEDDITDDLS
jgi:hypothetical protein